MGLHRPGRRVGDSEIAAGCLGVRPLAARTVGQAALAARVKWQAFHSWRSPWRWARDYLPYLAGHTCRWGRCNVGTAVLDWGYHGPTGCCMSMLGCFSEGDSMKADVSEYVKRPHQLWWVRHHSPLLWLVCLAPAGYLALVYSFVLRARLALGTWPLPYQPDPKALGFDLHHAAILLALPLWMASPISVLLLVALQRGLGRRKINLPVIVFGLLYLLVWLVLRVDPGSFMVWFMD